MKESLPIRLAERGLLPDGLIRFGIRRLLAARLRETLAGDTAIRNEAFHGLLDRMRAAPVALDTDAANEQHYEIPAAFFEAVLGGHLKYSCGYWPEGTTDPDRAEEAMLRLSCEHAGLQDGQEVLELGCGWGSLSLWMAREYPNSRITAVSNSASQRAFIERRRDAAGLTNLTVITADMRDFDAPGHYDRIVSVEMFEHMRNWEALFSRVHDWLRPGGRFFMHIFCHRESAYLFDTADATDWMGRHFFTGGLMPSDELPLHFQKRLQCIRRWRINGKHYARTCRAWLTRQDARREELMRVLAGPGEARDAARRFQRWRMFFMACEELFAWRNGNEWYVAHYLFTRPE